MYDCSNKTILITGGTGSLGKYLVKFLLAATPFQRVIVLSRDELKQYHLQQELGNDPRLRFFLGDVRDVKRLERAFSGVDVVIHAAALKQVPALEYNPVEAIQTNIIGSQHVVEAAIDSGVDRVILISTDKAAYPVNLYGSTKLCAEKLFVAANSYTGGRTKFSVVRYGNVLGSRGSIVETMMQQSGFVQITHEEMTRFWISLKQACELIMYAMHEMSGGEIFIPKIPSMRLIDLVMALAPDAQREVIGIRPGEKMHEVLLTDQEARHAVEVDNYYIILPEFPFWTDATVGYRKHTERGVKVREDFIYSSHTSEYRMTADVLREMMGETFSV